MSDSNSSTDLRAPVQKREVMLVPPPRHRRLALRSPEKKAVGLTAVRSAVQHLRREMGLVSGMRVVARMNQQDGFDCAGCAWPDPPNRSPIGEYCENGAKALAEEATTKRVDAKFFRRHSVEKLSRWPDFELGKSGRITDPMVLRKGSSHYEPISWEDAFAMIAEELNGLDSPDEAIFYTSGRTSNEAAFMYQLLVRHFGTNNLPDCSNMCHESSGVGLSGTVGIGKGSVTLEDLHIAEAILVIGQNPGTNHPRMLSALKKCKENGGKIVSINPLDEPGLKNFIDPQSPSEVLTGGTRISDLWLPVRINGDVALLKGIMKLLLEKEDSAPGSVFDHDFIAEKTRGYEALVADLRAADFAQLVEQSGIAQAEMQKVADLLARRKKIIICWAMGLTQQENGVGNIQEVVNLLLLRGAIGRPGAGTCPVRGHSNVQGDRTMGIYEKPKEAFLQALDDHFGIRSPREHGVDTVEAIHAMAEGKTQVFFAMGGNFISATPDSYATAAAMQNCRLTVQVSTKLNRSHVVTGEQALILPCIARSEADFQASGPQFLTVENSMGQVHRSRGFTENASPNLLSEPAIVARLGRATFGAESPIDWQAMEDNYDVIRDHIEAVIPGFSEYNRRVRTRNGFYLPNGAREGKFNTPDGKAHFTVNPLPEHHLEADQYVLMTMRSHDQYNTTIYGLDDRYRGIFNERRVLLMNRQDMKARGWRSKQVVNVTSHFEGEERVSENWYVVPYQIPRRSLGAYFPEANVLVPLRSVAKKSNTPVSKYVVVSLESRRR
ncbi:MAG: FdhF/YdeP family oxidoreductase [Bacteroidota bacterium]